MNREQKVTSLELSKELQQVAKEKEFELPESGTYWSKGKHKCTQDEDCELFDSVKGRAVVYYETDAFELGRIEEIEIQDELEFYQAYDVAELWDILPFKVDFEDGAHYLSAGKTNKDDPHYKENEVYYDNAKTNNSIKVLNRDDNLANAAVATLIYLIKNGLIK